MSTSTPAGTIGLAARAVRVARAHREADPDGFLCRNNSAEQWNRWARRARVTRTIAAALQVNAEPRFPSSTSPASPKPLAPIVEARDDSLHAPGCTFAPSAIDDSLVAPQSTQTPQAEGEHRVTT